MKKSLIYLITLMFIVFAVSCSEDDGSPDDPTDGSSAEAYYAGGVGSTFVYEGETTDSTGTTQYTRNANFASEQTANNTTYIQQNNVITIGPSTTSGDFLFRRSSTGMFIYIDPSVFTELLDSSGIDVSQLTVNADQEIRMIAYPFDSTPQWDAFKVSLSAFGGIISLDVLTVQGNYRGQEQVTVTQQGMTAEKVEYVAEIKIPESLEDIANPSTVTVSATAWFVKDVGLVKLQGSGFLISVLGGSEIDFTEDTSTASETLVSYNLQ